MISTFIPIYIFLFLAVFFAIFVICLKSAFATCLASSLFSSSCCMLYFFLNAPDVAMTEVAINVFLSTALFLMTARATKTEIFEKPTNVKIFTSLIFFVLTAMCIYFALTSLGEFGNIQGSRLGSGAEHLLISYEIYEIPNIITAVLANFRSFDTMGETIIVLTSAIGIFTILQLKNSKFSSL